jgi:hypothetical protein
MPVNDIFVMNFASMSYRELITWLLGTATLQEKHPFHGTTMPDWVPAWKQFRDHAEKLDQTDKAAANKDILLMKARDDEHKAALDSIEANASYIVVRVKCEKDDNLYQGTGYDLREKTKRAPNRIHTVSQLPLKVTAKRGTSPGSVILYVEADPAAGVYQVRICKGHPTGEDSYSDYGNFTKARIPIENLEQASWYYFIVRSIGNNEASPWSIPVSIIVV